MIADELIKDIESKTSALAQKLHEELGSVRSNRPSVAVIENIPVEAYGQSLTIQQVGSIGVRPPRDIEITVWDQGAVAAVVKAIQDAKIGLSVTNDGNIVRASLPQLTNERRAEFSKLVKRMAEDARIELRSRRDEANKRTKAAEADTEINEDQAFKLRERIQKIVDEANKKIEGMLESKLRELAE